MIRALRPLPEFKIPNPDAEIPSEAIEAVAALLLDLVEVTDEPGEHN
jgi:hypothetical protein